MKYKLSDVVDRINGNVDRFTTSLEYYVGGEHFESNELEITGCGLIKPNVNILGFKFHFAFQPGDVLYMARNPHLRKAGMVNFSGICSDASYILRTKDSNVLCQEYLAVIMQSNHLWDYCESHKVGSVNFAINWKTLANYEFDLPDINIQRSIANRIWAAYRVKQAYKKLISATDEMVKSRFIEWFGDMKYLTSDKTMSDFFDMKAGQSITAENIIATYDLELFPCYGGNGLRGYVTHYTHEGHYCLIGRQGALCGNVNLTDGKFFATEHAIVVTPKININTYWLFFALSEMNLNRFARGVAQPGLSVKQLETIPFSIPPTEEQDSFERLYRQADKSKFELKRAIEAIDKVIKSLING